jgi:arabinogalactan endo-1,4-beta-galactosidase
MKENYFRRKGLSGRTIAILVCTLCALALGAFPLRAEPSEPANDPGIFVKKVEALSSAFIRGVDVSSVIALEKSGVVFHDAAGKPQDFFLTLKENGVNGVRIRVWNDPFTAEGNGYGGGNCDLNTAIAIGKRATSQGLSVMLDFHYSDFWADPAKQQPPRAWRSLSVDDKATALYSFTKESLAKALDSGVDVHFVQVGNETTGFFCGEKNWLNICKLMNAGCRAVREVSKDKSHPISIVLQFTNPEKAGEYERYAMILKKQQVDYDVFASSWYPWWHGTSANLTAVLKRAAEISGKKVMCAEVSYAWTYNDGDGFANSISRDSVCAKPYPVTVQGQANAVRDAIAAVAAVGDAGIGVYYWEPAWLPVPGKNADERKVLWEKNGAGWASSYAAEYDPADAGKFFGGSSWDNQAMFDFDGKPLASLAVWRLAGTGAVTAVRADSIGEIAVRTRIGDPVVLPATVSVFFNDGTQKVMNVSWNAEGTVAGTSANWGKSARVVDMPKLGLAEYDVAGTVAGCAIQPHARVTIVEKNYLENPGFEDADLSMWNITNIDGKTTELMVQDKATDAKTGNRALHFWSTNRVAFSVEQTVKGLAPGSYHFSIAIHGGDAKNQDMKIYAISGGKTYSVKTDVDGWRNFRRPVVSEIPVVDGTVTVGAYIACDAKGWGSLDDFVLSPNE